ncbi:MAG: hypothetical protein AAGC68_14830, partial [Verrucomicrobiota bacterium]
IAVETRLGRPKGSIGGGELRFGEKSCSAATNTPLGSPKAGLNSDLDALAAYVSSLTQEAIPKSPHRQSDGRLNEGAVAGELLFISEGCATCHSGDDMTDGILHNVGTLRNSSGSRLGGNLPGIETPTLLGVWKTAPYLHNGSAATLEEVFTSVGGTVVQAETGSASGNASIVTQWTELNNDATVRGGSYAQVWEGGRLTLTDVPGGSGGIGAIAIRYSSGYQAGTITLSVNGTSYDTTITPTGNVPDWRYVNWQELRFEGITLAEGNTNTIEIHVSDPTWLPAAIDEITVSTPDVIALAEPHRRVRSLNRSEQEQLLTYLRQLDRFGASAPESSPPASVIEGNLTLSENGLPELSWTGILGVSSYLVFRGATEDFSSAGEIASTTTTQFADSTPPGNRAFYWVVSSNAGGVSNPFGPLSWEAEPPPPDQPPADEPLPPDEPSEAGPPLPDLSIGRRRNDLRGEDIYGGRQVHNEFIGRNRGIKTRLFLENDGGPGMLTLAGSPRKRDLKTRYFLLTPTRTNVTSTIIAGIFAADLDTSQSLPFLVQARHLGRGVRFTLRFESYSDGSPPEFDQVKLRLSVR